MEIHDLTTTREILDYVTTDSVITLIGEDGTHLENLIVEASGTIEDSNGEYRDTWWLLYDTLSDTHYKLWAKDNGETKKPNNPNESEKMYYTPVCVGFSPTEGKTGFSMDVKTVSHISGATKQIQSDTTVTDIVETIE